MTPEPCNPDRLPAERLAFVEDIHQQFAQLFAQSLSNDLDTPIRVLTAGIDQAPQAEFLAAAREDACLITYDLTPTRGHAWASLSGGVLFRILDILLGSPQPTAPATRTTITEIETNLLREFFGSLQTTLDRAWQSSGLSLRMASLGTADQVRQGANPDGAALVLNCKVKFGEDEESFRVAMPVLAIRLAALELERKAAEATGEPATRNLVLEAVSSATLELEAVLGGSSIRLEDLAALQPGQILMLTRPAGSQLDCLVNGKPKFRGEWIADGSRQGLQVDELVDAIAS